jgi:hypothetical protein
VKIHVLNTNDLVWTHVKDVRVHELLNFVVNLCKLKRRI